MYNILVTWTKDILLTKYLIRANPFVGTIEQAKVSHQIFSRYFVCMVLIFANVFTLWFEFRKSLVGNLAEWKSLVDEQHWGLIGPEGGAQHSNEHPSCPKSICDAGLQELRCCATVAMLLYKNIDINVSWYCCPMDCDAHNIDAAPLKQQRWWMPMPSSNLCQYATDLSWHFVCGVLCAQFCIFWCALHCAVLL